MPARTEDRAMTEAQGRAAEPAPGWVDYACLAIGLSLAAVASPVVKWLIREGGRTGLVMTHAISFCNLLFVGNVCAGILLVLRFGPRHLRRDAARVDARTGALVGIAVLLGAVVTPVLLYQALEVTSVANVALLLRVESVAYAALAFLVLGLPVSRSQWLGHTLVIGGVLALLAVQGGPPGRGHLLALATGCLYAVGNAISRRALRDCSLRLFMFAQNAIGGVVFFCIAVKVYGPHHFADAFSTGLWTMMTIYALLIVIAGEVTWYRALAALPPATVATWSLLLPVLEITFGYLLLREEPTSTHLIGAVIILTGLLIGQAAAPAADPVVPPERCLSANQQPGLPR
jgi:drug/metabolite transporter (DMT)-like permease